MKINDKVLAGLMVSLGLFSAGAASRYVADLSAADKDVLLSSIKRMGEPTSNGNGSVLGTKIVDGGTVLSAKVSRTV